MDIGLVLTGVDAHKIQTFLYLDKVCFVFRLKN